jgi:hypothetical protein
MGTFFTNLHARASAPETFVAALKSIGALPAYVTQPDEGWVGVYPEATEGQDQALLERVGHALSAAAGTVVYKAMLGRLDRKTRKMVAGTGRADAAEGLAQVFAHMLGIPKGRAQLGYTYISRGEAPEGFARLIPA